MAATMEGSTPGRLRMTARSAGFSAASSGSVRPGEHARDLARVGSHRGHEHEPEEHERRCGEPRKHERVRVEVLAREEGAEDRRPENRAEDGAEEDEGDAARATARRIHVTSGSASKEGGRARGADEDEPEENENREVESRAESREHASGDPEGEAGDQHGHSPEPVHGAARGKRRQSPGSEDDRRPQPDEAAHADDEDDGQGRDCRRELQHRRVRRQRGREQDRVAADGRLRHRLRIAYGP